MMKWIQKKLNYLWGSTCQTPSRFPQVPNSRQTSYENEDTVNKCWWSSLYFLLVLDLWLRFRHIMTRKFLGEDDDGSLARASNRIQWTVTEGPKGKRRSSWKEQIAVGPKFGILVKER